MTLDTSHLGGGGGGGGLLTGFEAPFPRKHNIEFQMFFSQDEFWVFKLSTDI